MPHRLPLFLIICCLALAACGRASHLLVRAESNININGQGEATPVDLRLYQLRDIERFTSAEFDPLWRDDAAVLGDDMLVQPKVVSIRPGDGQIKPRRIDLGPWHREAQSLGIMALYREPGGDVDRRRVVVSAWHADNYVIELAGYELHFRKH